MSTNTPMVERLKQQITKKLAKLRNDYEESRDNLRVQKMRQGLELNTTIFHQHSFEQYYQKLQDEIMADLQQLQIIDNDTVSQLVKTHVAPDYTDVVMDDLKKMRAEPKSTNILSDIVASANSLIQQYQSASKNETDRAKKETLFVEMIIRPFLTANRTRFNILLKEEPQIAMDTLLKINKNLRKSLCYQQTNAEGYEIIKSQMARMQHEQHTTGSNDFSRFLIKNFFYPVEGEIENEQKLSARLIYNGLVELGIKGQAKRTLLNIAAKPNKDQDNKD